VGICADSRRCILHFGVRDSLQPARWLQYMEFRDPENVHQIFTAPCVVPHALGLRNAYSGRRNGEKFALHEILDAALQTSQAIRLSESASKGIKIIDICAMATLAVETKAKPSFVKRCGETLLVLDQQAVSDLAQFPSSFLFTSLHLISVAYLRDSS
jgi:hypothetical protein